LKGPKLQDISYVTSVLFTLSSVLEQLLSNWFLNTWHKWGKRLC